jgi:hypothetical protein
MSFLAKFVFPSERDHLEDVGVCVRMILKMDLSEVGWGSIEWIALAQDRKRERF